MKPVKRLFDPRESLAVLPEEIPDRIVLMRQVRTQVEYVFEKYRANPVPYGGNKLSQKNAWRAERNIVVWKMFVGWDDGVCHTEKDIAQLFGISADAVRQIIAKWKRAFIKGLQSFAEDS
jgi:hypothetical protein